jgi:hypothetical protein
VPEPVAIDCEAASDDLLLVDWLNWLNRLIYEMAVRHMVFGRFAVTIAESRLHATPGASASIASVTRPRSIRKARC